MRKVIFPLFSKRAGSCSSGLKPKGNPRVRLKVNLFLGGGIIGACMPNIRYKKLVAELKLNGRNNLVHLGQKLPGQQKNSPLSCNSLLAIINLYMIWPLKNSSQK